MSPTLTFIHFSFCSLRKRTEIFCSTTEKNIKYNQRLYPCAHNGVEEPDKTLLKWEVKGLIHNQWAMWVSERLSTLSVDIWWVVKYLEKAQNAELLAEGLCNQALMPAWCPFYTTSVVSQKIQLLTFFSSSQLVSTETALPLSQTSINRKQKDNSKRE